MAHKPAPRTLASRIAPKEAPQEKKDNKPTPEAVQAEEKPVGASETAPKSKKKGDSKPTTVLIKVDLLVNYIDVIHSAQKKALKSGDTNIKGINMTAAVNAALRYMTTLPETEQRKLLLQELSE